MSQVNRGESFSIETASDRVLGLDPVPVNQDGCEFGILNLVNSIGLYETGKKHTRLLCEGSPMFASLYIGRHDFGNGLAAVVYPKCVVAVSSKVIF